MKIVIASLGKKETDKVSSVAGRAPYFLFFEDKKLVKTIKNPFRHGGGGAGFSVAKMVADENANVIVAGRFGPNMISALKEKNIKSMAAEDITVKQALEEALTKELKEL
ncbi:hypothetical protein GF374_02365 [Candidatus Woesearchaeota archaeon]|nr:hypothetical protein [Candidatus Woesearchaeota archaeon]